MTVDQRIVYDPRTGFYIDAETGEVLEEYEVVGGTRATRIVSKEDVEQKKHWKTIDLWLHDNGLYTEIGFSRNQRYRKLMALQRRLRVSTHSEKKLVAILTYIRMVCGNLGLQPRIIDDVCLEFKKLYKKLRLDRVPVSYRAIDKDTWFKKLIAYVILRVARRYNVTLTADEVAKVLRIRGSCISGIQRVLKIELKPQSTTLAFHDIWSRYLGDYIHLLSTAVHVVRKLVEDPLMTGKSRKSLVAGIAYMIIRAVGYDVTQKNIAKRLGLTEVTVRNTFKRIISRHNIIVEVE